MVGIKPTQSLEATARARPSRVRVRVTIHICVIAFSIRNTFRVRVWTW